MNLPTNTICGHCNRTVKLKRQLWEPWQDGAGQLVGMIQTRRCKCRYNIVAAIGDDEFMRTVIRHWNAGEMPTQTVH